MIRINIIDRGYLDIEDGSLSFRRTSGYFRWSKLEVGRSTEFAVPATDRNRMLLGFAEDPSEYGLSMRRKMVAQMQLCNVVKTGTLQVLSYSSGKFKCAFYYDGYNELQAINGKKLNEFQLPDVSFPWNDDQEHSADDPTINSRLATIVPYMGNYYDNRYSDWYFLPSVNVKRLAEACLDGVGLPHDLDISRNLWMVTSTLKGGDVETGTIAKSGNTAVSPIPQNLTNYLDWVDGQLYFGDITFLPHSTRTNCKFLKAKQTINVTFPTTLSNDIYVASIERGNIFWGDKYILIGGYGADWYGKMTGVPLAGRTVEIKKGTEFVFLDINNWQGDFVNGTKYGYTEDASPYAISIGVARSGDLRLNEEWRMTANLPDVTLVDLLRSAAMVEGKDLYYDVAGGKLTIKDVDLYNIRDREKIVSIDDVRRCVADWGAGTAIERVEFDSENYVNYRLSEDYSVANDTIDGVVTNKIPFSEGSSYELDGAEYVYIVDCENSEHVTKITATKPTLAVSGSGKALRRVWLARNAASFYVAQAATSATAKVAMDEEDFFSLSDHDYFHYRGLTYVWTSASWSGGICTLTLQAY